MKTTSVRTMMRTMFWLAAILLSLTKPSYAGHWEVAYEDLGGSYSGSGFPDKLGHYSPVSLIIRPNRFDSIPPVNPTTGFPYAGGNYLGDKSYWFHGAGSQTLDASNGPRSFDLPGGAYSRLVHSLHAVLKWTPEKTDPGWSFPGGRVYYKENSRVRASAGGQSVLKGITRTLDYGLGGTPSSDEDAQYGEDIQFVSVPAGVVAMPLPARTFRSFCSVAGGRGQQGSITTDFGYTVTVIDFSISGTPTSNNSTVLKYAPTEKEIKAFVRVRAKIVSPEAEFPDELYYDGEANYSVYAALNGQPLFNSPKYSWTANPSPFLPNQFAEDYDLPHVLPEGSTSTKDFHFDFGKNLAALPQTSVVHVAVTDTDSDSPIGASGKVTIHWDWPWGQLAPIRISPDNDPNAPGYDEIQQIPKIQQAYRDAQHQGAEDVKLGLEAYKSLADFYVQGPMFTLGAAAIAQVGPKAVHALEVVTECRAAIAEETAATNKAEVILDTLKPLDTIQPIETAGTTAAADTSPLSETITDLNQVVAQSNARVESLTTTAANNEAIANEAIVDRDIAEATEVVKGKVIPKEINDKTKAVQGKWTGERGESGWQSANPKVQGVTHGQPVEYKDCFPDFTPWERGEVSFKTNDIVMKGENTPDFNMADDLYAKQQGWWKDPNTRLIPDRMRVKSLRRREGLTWHHHEDGDRMQLVPSDLNNHVPHSGGASIARTPPTP